MSTRETRQTLDMIEKADMLLVSMKGQMQIAQERAEQASGPVEYNEGLHLAIVMQTMIDSVRSVLDDTAQHIAQAAM